MTTDSSRGRKDRRRPNPTNRRKHLSVFTEKGEGKGNSEERRRPFCDRRPYCQKNKREIKLMRGGLNRGGLSSSSP